MSRIRLYFDEDAMQQGQQPYSVGEQLRRLLLLVNWKSAEDMQGHLEYLANWGR